MRSELAWNARDLQARRRRLIRAYILPTNNYTFCHCHMVDCNSACTHAVCIGHLTSDSVDYNLSQTSSSYITEGRLGSFARNPGRCKHGPKTTQLLGCHLALSKVFTPLQWLLVLGITQKDLNTSLMARLTPRLLSEAVASFAGTWELMSPLLVLYVGCFTLARPMLAVNRSCTIARHVITMSCWVSIVLTSISCAYFRDSMYETVLVLLPCSASIGTSLGMLGHRGFGAESCLRRRQIFTEGQSHAEKLEYLTG